MDQETIKSCLNSKFPCREKQVDLLCNLLAQDSLSSYCHPCILVHGNHATGKLSVVKHFLLVARNVNYAIANCTTLYTHKLLVEHILNTLYGYRRSDQAHLERCDNFVTLICDLKKITTKNPEKGIVIVLKHCEKLDRLSLATLVRLQEYTGCSNISVVLITNEPPCSLQLDQTVPRIHFSQYTKDQLMKLLLPEKPDGHPVDFFENFLNAFVGSLYNVCRDLREMKHLISTVFPKYVEPIETGQLSHSDVVALWRHIAPYLKASVNNAYLGFVITDSSHKKENKGSTLSIGMKLLDLPYFTKYFLIAAYLASFISSKYDRRLFVKQCAGKTKKRMPSKLQAAKLENELVGAKSFSLDRLLAIFYAIIDDSSLNLTASLLSQVSTLVELKLLTPLSDGNLDKPNYKCSADKETIYALSKTVDFNMKKYIDVN